MATGNGIPGSTSGKVIAFVSALIFSAMILPASVIAWCVADPDSIGYALSTVAGLTDTTHISR